MSQAIKSTLLVALFSIFAVACVYEGKDVTDHFWKTSSNTYYLEDQQMYLTFNKENKTATFYKVISVDQNDYPVCMVAIESDVRKIANYYDYSKLKGISASIYVKKVSSYTTSVATSNDKTTCTAAASTVSNKIKGLDLYLPIKAYSPNALIIDEPMFCSGWTGDDCKSVNEYSKDIPITTKGFYNKADLPE